LFRLSDAEEVWLYSEDPEMQFAFHSPLSKGAPLADEVGQQDLFGEEPT